MSKNPIVNALLAEGYVIFVACIMFYGVEHKTPNNSILVPIAVLSLLTLSAAVMGFLFFFQPVQMYLDGKKKQAVDFLIKTIGSFAVLTLLAFLLIIFRILPL